VVVLKHSKLKVSPMKFDVVIDQDEDNIWIVECPAIRGCVSQGQTKEEALENIKDAIIGCLQVRMERELPISIETQQIEVFV
jgi:predicted RNase H-like HicB family nuclease